MVLGEISAQRSVLAGDILFILAGMRLGGILYVLMLVLSLSIYIYMRNTRVSLHLVDNPEHTHYTRGPSKPISSQAAINHPVRVRCPRFKFQVGAARGRGRTPGFKILMDILGDVPFGRGLYIYIYIYTYVRWCVYIYIYSC